MVFMCRPYLLVAVAVIFCKFGFSTFNGLRITAISKPDFRTYFLLRSNNGTDSFREVDTGQNRSPFRVRVYAKVLNGPNKGFCFEGVGAAQVSIRKKDSYYLYGGLIYGYNSTHVRIWAPSKYRRNENGRIVFVGNGWGRERYAQHEHEALVFVEVWYIGPPPTFQTSMLVDTRINSRVFYEIKHNLEELPERVVVRVTPAEISSSNYGFWFSAITSSQNLEKKGYGGVIFAYNAQKIELWVPSAKRTGCIFVQNGWGGGMYPDIAPKCLVEVFAWVFKFPVPSFTSKWIPMSSQGTENPSFLEITHSLNIFPSLVIVQARADNMGLIFEGTGAIMSTDINSKGYGGVLYAFDERRVRIWLPDKHNGTSNGYSILVRDGWAGGRQTLRFHNIKVRVILYTSNCDSSKEKVGQKAICKSVRYNSYSWRAAAWGRCSSICNKGHNYRRITGCEVSTTETVFNCGFANDMCGFHSSPRHAWKRITENQPRKHSWNYPRDSFYLFASVNSSEKPVILASPNFSPRKSCSLMFKYKMFGNPAPILTVLVRTGRSSPKLTGWKMLDNQGGSFWREAYVKLANFNRQTQVFIKFSLSPKPEDDTSDYITHGNVSVDDVKLECEASHKKVEDASVCRKNKVTPASCIHPATVAVTEGPAFDLFTAPNKETFVIASGHYRDLIASYDFMIDTAGEYSIWLYAWGTSNKDNGVKFQIDNMDILSWHTTYIDKGNRPVWSQFLYTTFTLKSGVHTVRLYQMEKFFKFKDLFLTPKRLSSWTSLGMQSRYIPDSNLRAYPQSSVPAPKYGRLHGEDAWCSSDHNQGFVRFEIALPELALISRIAVQGGKHIKKRTNSYWVTKFSLKVSTDGLHFSFYRVPSGKIFFKGNTNAGGIVEHEFPFAVLAKHIQIFPYAWKNWICMRVELYGVYTPSNMCNVAGQQPVTRKDCQGDRNCSTNAECRPITKRSIIKTGLPDNLIGREACHCHTGYHGDSCQHVGCKPNPCLNGGTCVSHANNFTCSCPPGYHGPLCQHTCRLGWYGIDCARMCRCSEHGICSVVTGYCSCEPGYFGQACDQPCPLGYFGEDCKEKCQCKNNGECNHVNGTCDCTAGWKGTYCNEPCSNNVWGVHCRQPCKCVRKNTISCSPISGKCNCNPGRTGITCQDTCPSGTYGMQCTGICQCGAYGTCDTITGSCTCHSPGWTGIKCDQPCPKGFYGVSCSKRCDCEVNGECDPISGKCKCNNGFSGLRCSRPCSKDRWGPACEHLCQCNHGGTCDSVTGSCQCSAGWYGTSCNSNCTNSTWGTLCQKKCDCNNSSCDSITGVCRCRPGTTGKKCEKTCANGFYGPQCQNRCLCVHGNTCDVITGTCSCPPGWLGRTCTEACPSNRYGDRCSGVCSCRNSATCDHVTGSCTCAPGWDGLQCNRACSAGSFGVSCSQRCSCSKSNSQNCHHVTGYCRCKPGYIGARCDQSCKPGYYGVDCKQKCLCQNGAECRPSDGKCTCLAGYSGDHCEHECRATYYGVNCSYKCSLCTKNQAAPCNRVTGKCLCSPGYYGYRCENHCPEGRYGPACALRCDCKHDGHCNHVNGTCECAPGFTGTKCVEPCPEGTFGYKCKGVCLCENGGLCDKVTGDCRCLAGFNGTQCRDVCVPGRFGIGCEEKCVCKWNHTHKCRADTGACECNAGYRGLTCSEYCIDGTYGKACKHRCPVCSRHVIGSCYKIDGRCPCSPGYRGHLCDNDCLLKNYGKDCGKRCECGPHEICYHVNGTCYNVTLGKFQIAIKENYSELDDIQRQKQIKLNIASFIQTYYGKYLETLRRLARREISPQSSGRRANTTAATRSTPYTVSTRSWERRESKHDFVSRILSVAKGLALDGGHEVTLITLVIFDKGELLNGSIVKSVMNSLGDDELSIIIGGDYYSGGLYQKRPTKQSVYVQLITGIAGGLLILIVSVIGGLMLKRRRRHLKKLRIQEQKEKEAETEMEMKTRHFRHNGYRLAFDNPYYDVLAAMALDDDIEDDYINPLCDLESLMSHQGSDGTVSSATECSIPKGESLQSVSYC